MPVSTKIAYFSNFETDSNPLFRGIYMKNRCVAKNEITLEFDKLSLVPMYSRVWGVKKSLILGIQTKDTFLYILCINSQKVHSQYSIVMIIIIQWAE